LNPSFPTPATQDIVIMGDFNAEKVGDPNNSLLPFAQGDMANWQWSIPLPDNGHSHTAIEDKYIIDHIIFSPSIATSAPAPQIYAYDYDPALGGPEAFHGLAAGVKRVSDHRPVTCILDW
jgi:hypothetical protein